MCLLYRKVHTPSLTLLYCFPTVILNLRRTICNSVKDFLDQDVKFSSFVLLLNMSLVWLDFCWLADSPQNEKNHATSSIYLNRIKDRYEKRKEGLKIPKNYRSDENKTKNVKQNIQTLFKQLTVSNIQTTTSKHHTILTTKLHPSSTSKFYPKVPYYYATWK